MIDIAQRRILFAIDDCRFSDVGERCTLELLPLLASQGHRKHLTPVLNEPQKSEVLSVTTLNVARVVRHRARRPADLAGDDAVRGLTGPFVPLIMDESRLSFCAPHPTVVHCNSVQKLRKSERVTESAILVDSKTHA